MIFDCVLYQFLILLPVLLSMLLSSHITVIMRNRINRYHIISYGHIIWAYHIILLSLSFIISELANIIIIVVDYLGWVRELTREGIEPNPGPSWDDFVEAAKKTFSTDYSEYEDDLKKGGRLYTQLMDLKKSEGKKPKVLLGDNIISIFILLLSFSLSYSIHRFHS